MTGKQTLTTFVTRPSVLTKGTSAEVQINIRPASLSGPNSRAQPIPLEPFSVNKEMGRILIRRGGETIGAGTLSFLPSLPFPSVLTLSRTCLVWRSDWRLRYFQASSWTSLIES